MYIRVTLSAFLLESGLSEDTANTSPGDLTIEQVLEDKKLFDLSAGFEKVEVTEDDAGRGWLEPAPSIPTTISTLPVSANLLHVSLVELKTKTTTAPEQVIISTAASRHVSLLSPTPPTFPLLPQSLHSAFHDSPVLSCVLVRKRYLLSTTMSGKLYLTDLTTMTHLFTRHEHKKFCIQVAIYDPLDYPSQRWANDPLCANQINIATAGWDSTINFYSFTLSPHEPPYLSPALPAITLPTNPLSILFLPPLPTSSAPILLVSRRDSTLLEYHATCFGTIAGTQSLTPLSSSHNSFSPSCISLCPTDPTLLAVATSHVPHRKLILVKLLLPSTDLDRQSPVPPPPTSSPEDAEKAIILHTNTMEPQTVYSTPIVVWRPSGKGVWMNGEDGIIRGIDTKTGKVVQVLRGGHSEGGTKVRCLWAGMVGRKGEEGSEAGGGEEEWVISGGFDQRLVVWRVAGTEERASGA